MTQVSRETIRGALALIERDWMGGDNLAVTLCSEIETRLGADKDPGTDTGWAEEVSEECDATLNVMADAIMAHFSDALAAQGGVRVKELTWVDDGHGRWGAVNPLDPEEWLFYAEPSEYEIGGGTCIKLTGAPAQDDDEQFPEAFEGCCYHTLEALQASCQRVFAKRHLSALDTAPVGEPSEGAVAFIESMIRDACHDATGANINGPAVKRAAKRIAAYAIDAIRPAPTPQEGSER